MYTQYVCICIHTYSYTLWFDGVPSHMKPSSKSLSFSEARDFWWQVRRKCGFWHRCFSHGRKGHICWDWWNGPLTAKKRHSIAGKVTAHRISDLQMIVLAHISVQCNILCNYNIYYIYASLYISHIITCFGPFFDKQSFVTFGCALRLWSSVSSHLVIGHILALALLELRVSIAWLLRYIGLSCSGTNGHGHQDTDVDDCRNLAARSELAKPCRIEGHAVHCLKVSIDLIDFVWTSKGWTLHYLIWHYIGHW